MAKDSFQRAVDKEREYLEGLVEDGDITEDEVEDRLESFIASYEDYLYDCYKDMKMEAEIEARYNSN